MTSDPVQSVRSAWINRLRQEALLWRRPEVSKAAHIGVWLATYADADGNNAFPSTATLAAIAGCSEETVTRCVRLLMAVGLLDRKRRPNRTAVYQLLLPLEPPNWLDNMHKWGESRQAKARKKAKEQEMAELLADRPAAPAPRSPSADAVRNPSPAGVPEPVPGGAPTPPGTRPRTGAEPVRGQVPEPVPGGGYMFTPTYGRDTPPHHDSAGLSPQPPTAGARSTDEKPAAAAPQAPRLVPPPSGGRRADRSPATSGSNGGQQRPLLLPVRPPAHVTEDQAQLRATATADEIRQAIAELGQSEAIHTYGWRLVSQHLPDTDTGT